ncbi:hypothetical protein IKD49_00880 [Candidatus Saccharibacteria bacterium]|nr:hypothetical protein [Candidatus Saccharibacteria bacterium]
MKRLLIIYNPRSSRASDVRSEVLDRLEMFSGCMVGRYEVAPTNLEDNILKLSSILRDDDLVISAGGDATGIIASNAILKSDKKAALAVLPYGNFNDLARTLRTNTLESIADSLTWMSGKSGGSSSRGLDDAGGNKIRQDQLRKTRDFYPLEIIVDGKFFRYATCYVTIGMTAEAVSIYDSPKMRAKLKKQFGRKISSYTYLADWYFKNRHSKQFIPAFTLNGKAQSIKITDYAAVNGRSMARVMKGGEDYHDSVYFRSEIDRLGSFWRLFKLMTKSIFSRIPGTATKCDTLEFACPATITLQSEGESCQFKDIKKIEIRKSKKCLKVIEN